MPTCCDPVPNPCTTTTNCTEESSTYCVRHNQGDNLSCIGVLATDNRRLSDILKLMDTAICAMSGAGDYSTYDVGCLSPVTTQQSWVEKISDYVCTLNTTIGSNYTTLVNMITNITDPNIGNSTNLTITGVCTEIAGLAYVNGTTTLSQHIIKLRTAICDTYNLLQTRTNLSAITWNSCFSSTLNVNTAIQNLIDQVCAQQAQIASISTAGACGKFDHYTFSDDFGDSVTSTTSCKNEHAVILNKEKLTKVSSTDVCDGYLGDKIIADTGIIVTSQTVTTTICNYTLSLAVDIGTPEDFVSVTIDATLYTAPSPIPVTNPTAINSYLNGLGLGAFTTILIGSQLIILVHEVTAIVPNSIVLSVSGGVSFTSAGCTTSTCEKVVVGLDNTYQYGTWYDPQDYNGSNLYSGLYTNGSTSPVKFRKSGLKTVKIKGMTNASLGAAVTTDQTIFTLPVGYRPLEKQRLVGVYTTPIIVEVNTNGTVVLMGTLTPCYNTLTYINISFDID